MTAPSRPDTSRDLFFMTSPALWEAWPMLPRLRPTSSVVRES